MCTSRAGKNSLSVFHQLRLVSLYLTNNENLSSGSDDGKGKVHVHRVSSTGRADFAPLDDSDHASPLDVSNSPHHLRTPRLPCRPLPPSPVRFLCGTVRRLNAVPSNSSSGNGNGQHGNGVINAKEGNFHHDTVLPYLTRFARVAFSAAERFPVWLYRTGHDLFSFFVAFRV